MMKESDETPVHWSRQKEQAAWQIKLLLVLFRVFPVFILRVLAFPVGFFYFLFSKRGRIESRRFLQKAAPFVKQQDIAQKCRSPFGPLRHIVSFSLTLVEKIQSWGGKFPFKDIHFQDDDIADLISQLESGKGAFLVCSHLGNSELLRGLAGLGWTGVSRNVPVTAIVDVQVNANFTRMLNEVNPQAGMDIISSSDINPHTAILLGEKLNAGELIAVAGDRTSAGSAGKNLMIPFLGEEAPFSQGVFYMAALLEAPVYFMFAMRGEDLSLKTEYNMYIHKFSSNFDSSRKERIRQSVHMAHSFAAKLEKYCIERPFQWYNFHDFWSKEV